MSDKQEFNPKPPQFLAMPRTKLGWLAAGLALGLFIFLWLFFLQAVRPGRDRSTFFSDPINALCLIGAVSSPIVGAIVALVAIIWKHERSWLLVPILLLGAVASFGHSAFCLVEIRNYTTRTGD